MHARERLYLTADKQSLVGEGSTKAAFLYAALGDEIPDSAAALFGLVDGRLKAKSTEPAKPSPKKQSPAATKEKSPASDKELREPANKDNGGGGQPTTT